MSIVLDERTENLEADYLFASPEKELDRTIVMAHLQGRDLTELLEQRTHDEVIEQLLRYDNNDFNSRRLRGALAGMREQIGGSGVQIYHNGEEKARLTAEAIATGLGYAGTILIDPRFRDSIEPEFLEDLNCLHVVASNPLVIQGLVRSYKNSTRRVYQGDAFFINGGAVRMLNLNA